MRSSAQCSSAFHLANGGYRRPVEAAASCGAWRALTEALPDIPVMSDFVPGYEASLFLGIGAPKNTPGEVIDRLNREVNTGLADPKIKARFADLGSAPLVLSPGDFGKLIADEMEKWGKVAKFASIKAE